MARPRKAESDKSKPDSVSLTPQAQAALERFLRDYPNRNKSDIMNAALLFLDEQAILGLDANCRPNDPEVYKDVLLKIAKDGSPPGNPPKQAMNRR